MIGRERELERARRRSRTAGDGHGSLLLLAGEAGVGKTRLAEAALAAASLACLRGVAAEHGASPYAPITAVLRELPPARARRALQREDPLLAHLAVLLPELGPAPAAPTARRCSRRCESRSRRSRRASRRSSSSTTSSGRTRRRSSFCRRSPKLPRSGRCSSSAPTATRRSRAATRCGGSARSPPRGAARRARTSSRSTRPRPRELAGAMLDGEPGPALRAALYDRTQGVPFFVEELAAALEPAAGSTPGQHGLELEEGSGVPIPETLRDALRIRAEGLSDEGRAALEAAAVVGIEVDLEVLAALELRRGARRSPRPRAAQRGRAGGAAFRHDLSEKRSTRIRTGPGRRSLHRELGRSARRAAAPSRS